MTHQNNWASNLGCGLFVFMGSTNEPDICFCRLISFCCGSVDPVFRVAQTALRSPAMVVGDTQSICCWQLTRKGGFLYPVKRFVLAFWCAHAMEIR